MTWCHSPPTRKSSFSSVLVKPFGPHQCTTWSGLLIASHTNSRGASIKREMMISRSLVSELLPALFFVSCTFRIHGLKVFEIRIEAIEALLPMPAILADKIGSLLQRCGIKLAGAPLRLATLCDQFGVLQHLEVLRYGRRAYREWLGKLGDRCLAKCQPRKNCT